MSPNLVPVQVHPQANHLHVALAGFANEDNRSLPVVQWIAGKLTPGSPAVPAQGTPGHNDYVPEVPAVADVLASHSSGQFVLTAEEWDNWDDSVSDQEYLLGLAVARLGFTLAS